MVSRRLGKPSSRGALLVCSAGCKTTAACAERRRDGACSDRLGRGEDRRPRQGVRADPAAELARARYRLKDAVGSKSAPPEQLSNFVRA